MQCTLCEAPLPIKLDEEYYECGRCHALLKDERFYPSRERERDFYLTHNNDVNDPRYQKFTAPISGYVLKHFGPDDRGLDFGSGTGPVISKVLKDHQYQIQQYDPYFANHPEVLTEKYDYIVSCEVIEHFYHPRKEFTRLRKMLNPRGQLICMTSLYHPGIVFSGWRYRKDPTHVIIYQQATVEYIAEAFDFKSVAVSGKRRVVWRCG